MSCARVCLSRTSLASVDNYGLGISAFRLVCPRIGIRFIGSVFHRSYVELFYYSTSAVRRDIESALLSAFARFLLCLPSSNLAYRCNLETHSFLYCLSCLGHSLSPPGSTQVWLQDSQLSHRGEIRTLLVNARK